MIFCGNFLATLYRAGKNYDKTNLPLQSTYIGIEFHALAYTHTHTHTLHGLRIVIKITGYQVDFVIAIYCQNQICFYS